MGQEELKKKLEELRNHLKEWLLRLKQASDVAPNVQKIIEIKDWEVDVISDIPKEVNEISFKEIESIFNNEFDSLYSNLPMMPQYNKNYLSDSSTAVSTPGASGCYGLLIKVGELGTPESQSYYQKYTKRYHELQEQQQRPKRVRELIEKLNSPGTLQRFDNASKAVSDVKVGIAERTSSANEMRNLLYGIKGSLFEMARQTQGENMTWPKMVQRLSKHGSTGAEYNLLIRQEQIHSDLIDDLSKISKDREGNFQVNLENIWTKILDHLFSVLGLVKLPTP